MGCRIRKIFSWLLLLGAIVLGVFLGLGLLNPPSAAAAIRQLEEAPGQVVYHPLTRSHISTHYLFTYLENINGRLIFTRMDAGIW